MTANECSHQEMKECRNQCCYFCFGVKECTKRCQLIPQTCGRKVNIHSDSHRKGTMEKIKID